MSTEQMSDDIRTSTIVSRSPGLAYERMREVRRTHFAQPLATKLVVESAMLAALAAALSLWIVIRGGPTEVSSGLVTLAAAAGAVVAAGVTAHVGVGAFRLLREPLTERQALALITVEDAAAYLGIASGGLLTAVTVGAMGVELLTGSGQASGSVVPTAAVVVGLAAGAGLAMAAGRYVEGRLPGTA